MSRMTRDRRERGTPESAVKPLRRKRGGRPETNSSFVQAFADALKDILSDEQHRAA